MSKLEDIRREYGENALYKADMNADPFLQLDEWLKTAIKTETHDPTAMNLATVDSNGQPDCRVVLLKGIHNQQLVFYTDYESAKVKQINTNAAVAVNFYWPVLARQIRIKGKIQRLSHEKSAEYFQSRPRASQIVAFASTQSSVIENRNALEAKIKEITAKYTGQAIPCPERWGGFTITPDEFEFFQGRDSRLHDRMQYRYNKGSWLLERLSP